MKAKRNPTHITAFREIISFLVSFRDIIVLTILGPISVAAHSKTWVRAARLLGLGGVGVRIRPGALRGVCCQVEVSATGRSPIQRCPTECSVSECDCVTSKMRMPWHNSTSSHEKKKRFEVSTVKKLHLVQRYTNFRQFFYKQESSTLSNRFIQCIFSLTIDQ